MRRYQDHYFRKAKQENYPARSVYKLQEMDKKFNLFSKGDRVLDLGAAPGSWSMYAAKRVGDKGSVIAVDLQEMQVHVPESVKFVHTDILNPSKEIKEMLENLKVLDLVISDMAPKTTGIKFRDQILSLELVQAAFEFSSCFLKQGGIFLAKVFASSDQQEYEKVIKRNFEKTRNYKPKGSRAESKELFFLGFGYRQAS